MSCRAAGVLARLRVVALVVVAFATLPVASAAGTTSSGASDPAVNDTVSFSTTVNGFNLNEAATVRATPSISTTPRPSSATVGQSISDTAIVSGGSSPTGTVTFELYSGSDKNCSVPLFTTAAPLSGGSASSSSYAPRAPGTYQWVATYNGDSNNNPVSSSCSSVEEQVSVAPATPSISTTPSTTSATVGQSISDTASVSGGSSPTGTVTFQLYSGSDCSGAPVFTSADQTLSGGSASSSPYAPSAPGTYQWVATYNGDSNNNPVSSPCSSETVRVAVGVGKRATSTSVSCKPSQLKVGKKTTCTATVRNAGSRPFSSPAVRFIPTGPSTPTGTVSFSSNQSGTFSPSSCTLAPTSTPGVATCSVSYTPHVPGSPVITARYGGDSKHRPSSGDTQLTVSRSGGTGHGQGQGSGRGGDGGNGGQCGGGGGGGGGVGSGGGGAGGGGCFGV